MAEPLPNSLSPAATSNTSTIPSDLRDIKPPLPMDAPENWAWLLLALPVALAAFWWWRKKPRESMPPPARPSMIPAHLRARQRLQAARRLLPQAQPFCQEVSAALRVYLEERFEFRAPERTTEEFLAEASTTTKLLPGQKELLELFLQKCDLVKFARLDPTEEELRQLLRAALRFVNETEVQPVTV